VNLTYIAVVSENAKTINAKVIPDAQVFQQNKLQVLQLLQTYHVSRKERTDLVSQISNAVVIEHAMKKENAKVILTALLYL